MGDCLTRLGESHKSWRQKTQDKTNDDAYIGCHG
jgi:hypothetical protein